jgi:MFS family permease
MKSFYISSLVQGLAEELISPFIPLYALSLGATKALIGLVSSLPNVAGLLSQALWGSVAEIAKKKKFLVIIGGIVWSLFWIPISFVKDPYALIALLTLQSILSSVTVPAWTIMFIELSPKYKRGEISGNLNTASGIGYFVGNILGGLILRQFGFGYFIFYMICFLGIISKLVFIPVKEPVIPSTTQSFKEVLRSTFSFEIAKNRRLMNLISVIAFLNFSVNIAGPFFSVYTVEKLGGNIMDVAIISAIGFISGIVFYRPWGTLVDYLGTRTVMLSCIIPISFYPFVYAISNNLVWVYLYAFIGQAAWAGFNTALFVYLSHILPHEKGSTSVAMYNMLTGLSSAIAPFVGGMIAEFAGIWFVFILSTILRLVSMRFLERVEEKVGLRPKGVAKIGSEPFGLISRVQTFISTYSLLIEKTLEMNNYLRKRRRST